MFNIPVVLLMFKREKIADIIKRVEIVKPLRVYLIGDGGRTKEEKIQVENSRRIAENAINWDCEVIKNYAGCNRGVYENIAGGAKWVFEREKWAIFLEDDNLPEVSFFYFCKEMLEKYERDSRIVWICGTNYLGKTNTNSNASYCFTHHMLPCGWASWSDKFLRFYDGDLNRYYCPDVLENISSQYISKALYRQYSLAWQREKIRIDTGIKPISWDMQMDFSIKANSLFGICPYNNQIENIGVDSASIHGGHSMSAIMTRRFCSMKSYALDFPLVHPKAVIIDKEFERRIGNKMTYPLGIRIVGHITRSVRKILNIPDHVSTKSFLLKSIKKKG